MFACKNNVIGMVISADHCNHLAEDLKIESVPEDTVVLELELEDKRLDVMIDSGAGVSVLDVKTARSIGREITPITGNLSAFDYSSVHAVGIMNWKMKVGEASYDVKWVVVEYKGSAPVVIMGRDILK